MRGADYDQLAPWCWGGIYKCGSLHISQRLYIKNFVEDYRRLAQSSRTGYTTNWSFTSRFLREEQGWKCERC